MNFLFDSMLTFNNFFLYRLKNYLLERQLFVFKKVSYLKKHGLSKI
jgi:hypothetical protein